MDKLSLAISVVALGGAGYLGYAASELSRELKVQTDANASLEARLSILEHEAAMPVAVPVPPPLTLSAPPAALPGSAAPAPGLAGGAPAPTLADLDRRLTKFEKMVEAVNSYSVPDSAAPVPGQIEVMGPSGDGNAVTYLSSVEDAQKALELSTSQRAEFERVVADTKKEIAELHKLPDAEGKTWEQAQKDGVAFENGSMSYDSSKLQAFREKTIPGRNESFGAAERRIADAGKKSLRAGLSSEQQAKFDKTRVDGLLGTGGGGDFGFMTTFISTSSDSQPPDLPIPLPAPPPIPVPPPR